MSIALSNTLLSVEVTDSADKGSCLVHRGHLNEESDEEYSYRKRRFLTVQLMRTYYKFFRNFRKMKVLKEVELEKSSEATFKDIRDVVDACLHLKTLKARANYSKIRQLIKPEELSMLAPHAVPLLKRNQYRLYFTWETSTNVLQRLTEYISRTGSFKLSCFELKEMQHFILTCFETMTDSFLSVSVDVKPKEAQTTDLTYKRNSKKPNHLSVIMPETKAYQLVDYADFANDLTIRLVMLDEIYALCLPIEDA
ncbi:hypothetical protein CU098_012487 [Rhizopus stolonifer]|uniref:Uncharacterized protein n=1 Tax=Rhizopus stolonifer TaxID=4846 RepID=A0A367KT67_RHIST|nr:hypothetical protein CU098_012487 [Rhizopus stolonifer]